MPGPRRWYLDGIPRLEKDGVGGASSDSCGLEMARRFEPTRETSFIGLATGTGAADSSRHAAPSLGSISSAFAASIAAVDEAVDEAVASPDSLLDDDAT